MAVQAERPPRYARLSRGERITLSWRLMSPWGAESAFQAYRRRMFQALWDRYYEFGKARRRLDYNRSPGGSQGWRAYRSRKP